jgi:hypothetical protein
MATLYIADVPAPSDQLSLGNFSYCCDETGVIKTLGGDLELSGGTANLSYVIDPTLDDDLVTMSKTYAVVDGVFAAQLGRAVPLTSSPQPITAADLNASLTASLLGQTAAWDPQPPVVDIIVADTQSGVRSYQLFEITFLPL